MPTHTRVLVVDADGPDALALRHVLAAAGYETSLACSTDAALDSLERVGADVVLLALAVTGLHGVTLIAGAPGADDGAQLVVMAASGEEGIARDALRLGAFDSASRNGDTDALLFAVERAAREGSMRRELALLRARAGDEARSALVGRSGAIARVRELVGRAASTRMTVLVTGEAGTGKDVVARLVHDLSDRAGRPYVTVRCSGNDPVALETELFGASRGAGPARCGLFEEARGGTLVLDEMSDVPQSLRERLARVLAERAVRRIGGSADLVPVDVRLVLTAREELERSPLFTSGDELMTRLNVLPISVPPLRDRRSDIPLLVQHFRARLARSLGVELPPVASDVMTPLLGHQWPGNVRELEHWVERSVYEREAGRPSRAGAAAPSDAPVAMGSASWTLEELERRYILHVLDEEEGHQSNAAERLGIDRRTLYRKLKQYRGDEYSQAI